MGLCIKHRTYFEQPFLNNIRIGREEASEAEVWAVLEKVGLKRNGCPITRRFTNNGG
ncbi:hypothetical protein JG559_00235 [Enterococcus faecalis]|uniref:Uncharacterized protein n=1 Tax=Enterococcus faecalis TaxID=1351 RepID=A0A974NZ52_ENTFL|nr:hypothetical protein JG559_00235 [Enterococcus faecalis]